MKTYSRRSIGWLPSFSGASAEAHTRRAAQPSSPLPKAVLATFLMMLAMPSMGGAGTLHDAAKSGDLALVQHLIVSGSDVNAKGADDETPLITASLAGEGEIANYLLQRGADITARNSGGLSALHAATYAGYRDIVALLVTKGADFNDNENRFGVTPLHLAAEENHLAVVELLLERGADPTAIERNGYSVLSRAGFREHWEIVALLLANGANCQDADTVGDWLYAECSTRAVSQ